MCEVFCTDFVLKWGLGEGGRGWQKRDMFGGLCLKYNTEHVLIAMFGLVRASAPFM